MKDPVHVMQRTDPETSSHFVGSETAGVQVTDTEELFHVVCR